MIQTVDSAKLARRLNEAGRAARRHARSEALATKRPRAAPTPAELPALIDAVRGCPQSAPARADDHAAMVGRSRSVARRTSARLRELAEQHGLRAAFHGHVARSGDGHRRRRDLRARGHGAVRQAEEAVTRRLLLAAAARRAPAWPTTRPRCSPSCAATAAWKSRPRAATSRSTTWATISCTREIYRRALAQPGRGGAARRRAAPFPSGPARARPRTSTSSSTTTASGIASWRASCGAARAASGADQPLLRLPHAAAHRGARARRGGAQSGGGARGARARAGARVVEIPHLFAPPATARRRRSACATAQRLGVAPGAFLFGVFGYLRESKRLMPVLRGLRRACTASCRALRCWSPAQFVSTDLERAVGAAAAQRPASCACRICRSASSGWRRAPWMPASTCAIPAAGETSGIAIRLMGIGKPVLLTDGPECAPLSRRTPACALRAGRRRTGLAAAAHDSANIDCQRWPVRSANGGPGTSADTIGWIKSGSSIGNCCAQAVC